MITYPKKRYILLKKQPSSSSSSSIVSGAVIIQGFWDMSAGLFPSTGVTTSQILRGYQWKVSVSGVVNGVSVDAGSKITAWVDNPGQTNNNWDIIY